MCLSALGLVFHLRDHVVRRKKYGIQSSNEIVARQLVTVRRERSVEISIVDFEEVEVCLVSVKIIRFEQNNEKKVRLIQIDMMDSLHSI